MDSYVQKYCKGNKGTLAKFDVVFWLYTESADDRKPLLVNLQLLVVALFLIIITFGVSSPLRLVKATIHVGVVVALSNSSYFQLRC